MKKRLLSIVAMAIVALGMQAQDLTSTYLKNADFSADTPVREGICTYAKDVADNGTTLSGMQPVTDWVESNPVAAGVDIDAKASGIFELGKQFLADYTGNEDDAATEIFLGGKTYFAPIPTDGKTEGNVLGMVAVWGAKLSYTQDVTLPAGTYTLEVPVWNVGGGTAVAANNFGFIADNGVKYVATEKTWTVGEWITMKVTFTLTETTSGKISLGYDGANVGSKDAPHLFVASVSLKNGDADLAAELKETLASLIEQAEDLSIDVTAYQAILDNPNATSAQVQAAIDELKNKIENAMTDFTDYFINNAHFTLGTPLDNGVCTYDYDMEKNGTTYYGMQPIQDWIALTPTDNTHVPNRTDGLNAGASGLFAVGSPETVWLGSAEDKVPTTKANGSTEGNLFGFISVWSKNSYYYQEVTLPAGSYTISIPTYNERGTGAIAKNMCGFIAEDGTEYLAQTTTFPVNKWVTETIKFKLEEETSGKICIGYEAANAGSGSMPHLFVDEFLLKFNGKTDMDPSLLALNGAIRTGEGLLNADDYYEAALRDALQDAVDAGNDLKNAGSADAAANTAAATAINNAVAAVRASITVYKKFHDFIEGKLSDAIDKYIEGDLEDFATELAEDKDTYITAWEDGEYTTEKINEIINGFDARVAAAIKAAFEAAVENGGAANLDITSLFADKNLGYVNSNVDGWKNETGTSAFLSRVQTAEVWNQASFNVYQTLEDLPAGVYEIKAPGFYRTAANVDNYTEWQNGTVAGTAYIYAGSNRTLMHNVAELASDDQTNRAAAAVEGELYVPNNNDNAHYFFYDQDEFDVTNSVKGVLAETGTLTIGVKGADLAGNAWVVWGGFSVIYKGTEGMEAALYEEVKALSEEASALADELGGLVVGADDALNNAIDGAAECSESSSIDDLKAAIKALNEAIAYGNESSKLMSELETVYELFSSLMDDIESEDEAYITLIDEIGGAMDDGYQSNEQIAGFIESLKNGWAAYVQYDVIETATEEEPADISAAILNRGFEGIKNSQDEQSGEGNGDYWVKTREGGNDFGYQFGVYESYNTNKFDIHQTLKGLAAGYYKVTVQGFYRAGDNQQNADAVSGDSLTAFVYFYANAYEKKLNNQLENGTNGEAGGVGAEPSIVFNGSEEYHVPNNREACAAQFSIDLYMNELVCKVAEGEDLTIGLKKVDHVAGDWCPFDNFKLYYLGTSVTDEPVTAIESVEAINNANVVIFDLAGRRVAKAVKGIYIINGKKVVK